ncbi:SusC/RagA family TonB-linked outer membrane protein [Flavitalea sp. BT771]|uniref:SusC/RagA family TonB-linked outer membrane protein n=1 Tax=Flavitalea sp. BT771 TaxID=3063329 RepID=UPI0026E36082|nr:SusC/RagA family TonB-linked outer membrane protein [Flavitalea sp. BT771]MDO6433194.1 SusC/RagA family TonB-linked outer membrane protein [Flavitalea sp. BT771]MDV6221530.1 SusC/RagA family TonB-linked outer membrane protein [Flavitalea sp. BT771]
MKQLLTGTMPEKHGLWIAGLMLIFFSFSSPVQGQSNKVNGVVISKADSLPLQGVTVAVKGTKRATVTNIEGKFEITASPGEVIQFSFIGYTPLELPAGAEGPLQVSLEQAKGALNEVVVTALGISRQKKSLGYAVQELKSKDISETSEPNLVNTLEGKVAGVRVTNSQGDMGSSRIVIRGETSISGYNQPLFVINGFPVDNSQLGAGGSRDFANSISDVNPSDIESISFLKGPNAAALYGSRAAHGVVLIKTKSGRKKKGLGITVNSNTTFSNLLTLPKYQNVFGQGANGEFSYKDGAGGGVNDNVDESWGPKMNGQMIPQFFDGTPQPFVPHPDNVKSYFKTGVSYNNGVAFGDAGEKYDYRFSANTQKMYGVIPNSDLGRNNFSLNTTLKLDPKLTFTANVNYVQTSAGNVPGSGGKRATSTMLQFIWMGRQVDMNKLRDHYYSTGSPLNWNNSYYSNPFFVAEQNTVGQRRDRIIGNVGLSYKITSELTANLKAATDYYTDRRKLRIAYGTSGTPFGSYEEDAYTVREANTEFTLNYNKKLSSDFALEVLGGTNIRTASVEQNDQKAPKLAVAGLYTLTNSRDPLVSLNNFSKLKTYSIFGSAQLSFRNYAFLNFTSRNDWASTLPIQNLSYFYPSVSASLVLSDAFDIKSDVLSYAKIRGGWSKVGAEAGAYQLNNTFPFITPTFGTYPQLTAGAVDLNSTLKPEMTTASEIGAEAGFFNNRVRLDLSLYHSSSYNQILNVDVSTTTGYKQKLINGGRLNNKGIEVQLGVTPVKTAHFTWDINANYASNRSKLISLDEQGKLQTYSLGNDGTIQVVAPVGGAYGSLYGTAFLRNAQGQIIVNDDGSPAANPTNKILGKYTPDWLGGVTNTFTYDHLSLSVLIDGSFGGSQYSSTNATGSYTGVLASTLPGRDAAHGGLSYYYPGNDNSVAPVAGTAGPAGEKVYDDGIIFKGVTQDGKANKSITPASQYYKNLNNFDEAWIYSSSFIKLREVRLGYDLPARWLQPIGFAGATVTLVGRNLWIIHKKVPNVDPETAFNTGNAQGLEDLSLPGTRSYGINVNFKF